MSASAIERARVAWGAGMPEWVRVLAEQADATSQNRVAQALGFSAGIVSQVLSNKYPGRLDRIEQSVSGLYLGATVECPVLGEIRRDHCAREQKRGLTFENPIRPKVYRACRDGCPHSRLTLKGENDDQ
ncbi:transcriptional regulator [Pyruvatibacter sp.]|uniref:transcriptional regulator n=1 Tax=Pyruvatibacter sp. TaxID=1981328 RepID=UPI0032F02A6C